MRANRMTRKDECAIGVEAGGLDYRTVRGVYQGKLTVRPIYAAAVRAAAKRLGYPAPPLVIPVRLRRSAGAQ